MAEASVKVKVNFTVCPKRLVSLETSAMLKELSTLFFVSVAVPAGAVDVRIP
jgi:hypothetical protein